MDLTRDDLNLLSLALTDRLAAVKRRVEGDPHATPHDFAAWGRVGNLLDRVRAERSRLQEEAPVAMVADLLDLAVRS